MAGRERGQDTVRSATFAVLRAHGIDRVFGNPGSTELGFLRDWPDDIDYVLGLQEASVVGMADGYAQATSRPAFVNLHSAAGVGHALGNLFTSFRNHTPLVVTAGQQARSLLPMQPFLYAERATEFPRPYVKWAVEPARAADVPAAIARAIQVALLPPCGPTFVSVPSDDWGEPAEPVPIRRPVRTVEGDGTLLADLAAAIGAARRPAFVVGPAIDQEGAVDAMVALAERARAAVWVSPFSGRCSFPERHPLFAGFLHASPEAVSDALRPYDLVVVLGAPVFTFHVEGRAAILSEGPDLWQITSDPDEAGAAVRATSILSSLAPALARLLASLPEASREAPAPRPPVPDPAPAHPIPVEYLLAALSAALPPDAVVVEEAPSHRPAMHRHLPMRGAGSFYTMASGGLGWSLPASVGVALARPGVRTVCLIGDGSALYSIQALWTAAQRGLPLTVIVLNNAGYGAMRSFARLLQAGVPPGTDLPGLDLVGIAAGLGCAGRRVERAEDLSAALAGGLAATGPCLLDVAVDASVPVLYRGPRD